MSSPKDLLNEIVEMIEGDIDAMRASPAEEGRGPCQIGCSVCCQNHPLFQGLT